VADDDESRENGTIETSSSFGLSLPCPGIPTGVFCFSAATTFPLFVFCPGCPACPYLYTPTPISSTLALAFTLWRFFSDCVLHATCHYLLPSTSQVDHLGNVPLSRTLLGCRGNGDRTTFGGILTFFSFFFWLVAFGFLFGSRRNGRLLFLWNREDRCCKD
jgi:hypothetical protein